MVSYVTVGEVELRNMPALCGSSFGSAQDDCIL